MSSEWPKAPQRRAEREESSRKLRTARATLAPVLESEDDKPTLRPLAHETGLYERILAALRAEDR